MVRAIKVNNLEKYPFRTVSRNEEYAGLNDDFSTIFEMNNVDTILDFALKYFKDVTGKCTKWYIHTKNDSILACQKDLLLCKLTEADYKMIQATKLNTRVTNNAGKRQEDKSRPYILEINSIEGAFEFAECLRV